MKNLKAFRNNQCRLGNKVIGILTHSWFTTGDLKKIKCFMTR